MGHDRKYGQVTTENGDIPGDEPVIVLRGRDRLVPELVKAYRDMCAAAGSPQRHLELIDASAAEIGSWQASNQDKVRTPDSERSRSWLPE